MRMGEFELVRHMRIDFNLIPIKGILHYSIQLNNEILRSVRNLVVIRKDDEVEKSDFQVCICRGESQFGLRLRKFNGRNKYDKQLRDGDPGYVVIRGAALLRLVDSYPGDDWDNKFENARLSLIHELNCKLYDNGSQILITYLHTSQDSLLFTNLLSEIRDTDTHSPPPTFFLDCLPPHWLVAAHRPALQDLFHSLAKIRDLDFGWNNVSIQFKNYKHCYKALKKLCSYSLKKNGDGKVVDYELTLKDNTLVPNAFDQVLAYINNGYNQSSTIQALNNRVAMLEKEFNTIKAITEKSKTSKGSSKAWALNHRAIMLEKRLDIVKSVMDEFGAESSSTAQAALRHRVSILTKELSTIRPVLEDLCIGRIQALEMRVKALEDELKNKIESAGLHNEWSTDQALKRCKRLRRD